MILKRLILLTIITINALSIYGGDALNYSDKSIVKTLEKHGIEKLSDFQEIPLPDSIAAAYALKGKFYTILTKETLTEVKHLYTGRVSSCRAGICSINEDVAEYFDYIILFNKNKGVVQVKVFNYQATHGQEITAKSWLKQFIGYQGNKKLEVNKNIDSISGATISTYAITEDINEQTRLLQRL